MIKAASWKNNFFLVTARLAFTIYRSPDALKRLAEADHQLFITLCLRLTLATLCTMLGLGCVKILLCLLWITADSYKGSL
jgi:hypothetical protein